MPGTATRVVVAQLDGPDSADIRNPIHSTEVAKQYGFQRALVGGVTVYGWGTPPIIDVLGESWLTNGWVDVRFKSPTYPGNVITITVEGDADMASFTFTNEEGGVALEGTAGLGEAPWASELTIPVRRTPEPHHPKAQRALPGGLPMGMEFRPLRDNPSLAELEEYVAEKQLDEHGRWRGEGALVHPGWIAGRMTRLLFHNFDYGPAIHARSQIQHRGAMLAGHSHSVTGTLVDAYERKGHHYWVTDGAIFDEASGDLVAQLRHTSIFRVATVDERAG